MNSNAKPPPNLALADRPEPNVFSDTASSQERSRLPLADVAELEQLPPPCPALQQEPTRCVAATPPSSAGSRHGSLGALEPFAPPGMVEPVPPPLDWTVGVATMPGAVGLREGDPEAAS